MSTNPKIASRNTAEVLELNMLSKTVRCRLQKMGLRYCKAKCKPHINQTNIKKRLGFAKKYVNISISFWRRIMWSDESKFELQQLRKGLCMKKINKMKCTKSRSLYQRSNVEGH